MRPLFVLPSAVVALSTRALKSLDSYCLAMPWRHALCLATVFYHMHFAAAKPLTSATVEALGYFGDIFDKVQQLYVKETDDKALIQSAIRGMITSLDPHSDYLTEEQYQEMMNFSEGKFGGLGIEITMQDSLIKIISPFDDGPAARAGVKAGDMIYAIDDLSVVGMSMREAVEKMRGDIGQTVRLTIFRANHSEPLKFEIKREHIKMRMAHGALMEDIAYIRLNSFTKNTAQSLETEWKNLQSKATKPLRGVILDLRNNPGGLFSQAIAVADAFLDSGEIVSTRGRNEAMTTPSMATPGDLARGLPMVILINHGSASASEIVAGALRDNKRTILMGTKSFGKGSVQNIIHLDGGGALKLTIANYYTPSGRSIQSEGIHPDIVVEPAKLEFPNKKDDKNALLDIESTAKKYLHYTHPVKKPPAADGKSGPSTTALDPVSAELYKTDFQLARAIDLLHGLSIMKPEAQPPLASPAERPAS
jgi:carboxyl-terminal processing protease